jgi:hypothetical protein
MENTSVVVEDADQTVLLLDRHEGLSHPIEIGQIALVIRPIAFAFSAYIDTDRQEPRLRQLAAGGLPDEAVAASDHRNLHGFLSPDYPRRKDRHANSECSKPRRPGGKGIFRPAPPG